MINIGKILTASILIYAASVPIISLNYVYASNAIDQQYPDNQTAARLSERALLYITHSVTRRYNYGQAINHLIQHVPNFDRTHVTAAAYNLLLGMTNLLAFPERAVGFVIRMHGYEEGQLDMHTGLPVLNDPTTNQHWTEAQMLSVHDLVSSVGNIDNLQTFNYNALAIRDNLVNQD
jgi:hypothetical protein